METPKCDTSSKCEMIHIWNRLVNMPELSLLLTRKIYNWVKSIICLINLFFIFQKRLQRDIHDAQHKFLFIFKEIRSADVWYKPRIQTSQWRDLCEAEFKHTVPSDK